MGSCAIASSSPDLYMSVFVFKDKTTHTTTIIIRLFDFLLQRWIMMRCTCTEVWLLFRFFAWLAMVNIFLVIAEYGNNDFGQSFAELGMPQGGWETRNGKKFWRIFEIAVRTASLRALNWTPTWYISAVTWDTFYDQPLDIFISCLPATLWYIYF